jgi:hypothetical protein
MKKIYLILLLLSIIFFPSNLHAKEFYIKLSFGLAQGGAIEDSLLTPPGFNDYVEVSQEIHPNFGMDVYVEFTYHLNRYIGFSIGNGYISKTLTGKTSEYDRAGLGQIFTVFPNFSMEVIPICISLELSLPLTSAIKFNLKGGLGYYFMRCEGNTTWQWGGYNRSTYNFDGNSNQIGYHFGASFDKELSMNLFLSIDAEYKIVNFKNMQSSEVSGSLETGEYLQWFMYETFTEDFDYIVSQASITGFSMRVGFKFKF